MRTRGEISGLKPQDRPLEARVLRVEAVKCFFGISQQFYFSMTNRYGGDIGSRHSRLGSHMALGFSPREDYRELSICNLVFTGPH